MTDALDKTTLDRMTYSINADATKPDFTPTKGDITLHGLGFIQIKMPNDMRMHVWHPDLPRRKCFSESAIHNHRFSFRSTVLKGRQINQRVDVHPTAHPVYHSHDIINHNGPRGPEGGRRSFVDGGCEIELGHLETYEAGESYIMDELEYHMTPNSGKVATIMEKLTEGTTHACSIIETGITFDQGFDRYQLSEAELWDFVRDVMESDADDWITHNSADRPVAADQFVEVEFAWGIANLQADLLDWDKVTKYRLAEPA